MKTTSFNPSRKREKNGKPGPKKVSVTHDEVSKAIRVYKARGGLIQQLPDQFVRRRQKVRVSSPYEELDVLEEPFQ
ncbi:MAG: hypothetical protein HYT22_00220 [Candidatus Niyogibacteria bacterium]|nr:hypothetical protein [Candidatus Niyogibacteria bacterium]